MTPVEGGHHEYAVAQAIPLDVGHSGRSHDGADEGALLLAAQGRGGGLLRVEELARRGVGGEPEAAAPEVRDRGAGRQSQDEQDDREKSRHG